MKHTSRFRCKYEGCNEWGFSEYDSRSEQREADKFRREWKCVRHTAPDEVLSPERALIETTVISSKGSRPESAELYWNGFWGYAKDFPEVTKLTVTVRIQLPNPLTQETI